jgi:hypothetical protein
MNLVDIYHTYHKYLAYGERLQHITIKFFGFRLITIHGETAANMCDRMAVVFFFKYLIYYIVSVLTVFVIAKYPSVILSTFKTIFFL